MFFVFVFLSIHSWVEANELYLVQKRNVVGTLDLSFLQKMIIAIRMIAYRVTDDLMDEYLGVRECTVITSLKKLLNQWFQSILKST